jgi:predicted nuclease with TOPRIM domain
MTSSSTPGDGAINLLEKYTTLNRSMDDARRENAKIQAEMESIRLEIEKLQSQRVEMKAPTKQAQDETASLHTRVNDALDEYNKLEQRHSQALLNKTEACRQLQFTKSYIDSSRLDFLQQSRDFRTTCKRMRLSASAVGEESATSMAFLEHHHVTVDWTNDTQDTTDNGDLEQAIQAHAQCKQERDEAQRTLEAVRAREEAASIKSSSRESQKNKLLAQVERVRRETTDCEHQLRDLDQQTKEAREMAHNYEKDVNRRMSSNSNRGRGLPPSYEAAPPSVTPNTMPSGHGPPQNPYAAARNASSRSRAPPRNTQQSVGRSNWDANEAQPHLMNRRRLGFTNRQFGSTALDIISGRETEQDDDGHGAGSPPGRQSMAYQQTNSTRAAAAVSSSVNLDISDSDDDDDEDLFSGPVFLKK